MRGNVMNLLEVGALLKRERERCGISIRDVMDVTKISRRNLTALEEGQVKSLPHPVYLKGYVRNIAKMVRLDADELAQAVDQQYDSDLSKYLPQVPAVAPVSDTPAADSTAADSAAPRPEQHQAPPAQRYAPEPEREGRPRFASEPLSAPKPKCSGTLRSIIVLTLLVAALIGLLVQYQRMHTDSPPPPAPASPPVASAINATAPDNASADQDNASGQAAEAGPAGADMPAAQPAPEPARAPAPATQSVPATSFEVTRKAPVAEMHTPGLQQLTITAKPGEVCWIEVNDGKQSRSFTLRNGETHQVEFANRVRVRLGNAGGVTFSLNGQDHPFDGKRGSIETVEFGAR